jgi:N6-L-threonylcarbamoyladenine synthase
MDHTSVFKTYLAIETSCDETSLALVRYSLEDNQHKFNTLSHVTLSQIELHRPYGGVYPNLARREHETNIIPVLVETLERAGMLEICKKTQTEIASIQSVCTTMLARESIARPFVELFVSNHKNPEIDGIIVTSGPGLAPALWVGVNVANTLGALWQIPVLGVNHMEGHIYSVFATSEQFVIPDIRFPALSLLISGGHSELVLMRDWYDYTIIGQTLDDAVGEAFDKTARLMGLPYPGGPEIDRLASVYKDLLTEKTTMDIESYTLPRPLLHSGDYNFSFSGLKTAVRYLIEKLEQPMSEMTKSAIAYEFESAVIEVLIKKTQKAIDEFGVQTLILGGGVAANIHIRSAIKDLCEKSGTDLHIPVGVLSMDNALMIAIIGSLKFEIAIVDEKSPVRASGSLILGQNTTT